MNYYLLDILMTRSSTVGLEAMLFDKPVITFNPIGTLNSNPYAGTDAVIKVYKKEHLAPAIKDALYNKEIQRKLAEARHRFVYEYAYLQDGKASQRIVNLIKQMLNKSLKSDCSGNPA